MEKKRLFAVDDAESACRVLEASFRNTHDITCFASAEACLQALDNAEKEALPDLFLLDVDLPGIDGYSLCRQLLARPELAGHPVIFLSALDDLDSRLEGYAAGGIDFIVKPYKMAELKQKVDLALAAADERQAVARQLADSDQLTSLVLSNLDEYAGLIHFLRQLNAADSETAVANAVFKLLQSFKLSGAVQFRLRDRELTLSERGENSPLEISVITHVRTLGSIFEFKRRAVFNQPRLTLLINDMPTDDSELCGRLRDHLAIAAESADAKLDGLQAKSDNISTQGEIGEVLTSVRRTLTEQSKRHESMRYEGNILTQNMLDEMRRAFAYLGLTDNQENQLQDLLRDKIDALTRLYDREEETQATFEVLARRLSALLPRA